MRDRHKCERWNTRPSRHHTEPTAIPRPEMTREWRGESGKGEGTYEEEGNGKKRHKTKSVKTSEGPSSNTSASFFFIMKVPRPRGKKGEPAMMNLTKKGEGQRE